MAVQTVPTKGNLLATKKSLELSRTGFELLDRKRNILIREMMALIDRASAIQDKIDLTYAQAYQALQTANVSLGICQEISRTVPLDDSLRVAYRSVMGVEIPMVSLEEKGHTNIPYGLSNTNSMLDRAYERFNEVKRLTAELAEVENSVYRLADAIKKTQKRANALKNIMIPRFEATVKFISDALEEKDREEFSRLKVIKSQKARKKEQAAERRLLRSHKRSARIQTVRSFCHIRRKRDGSGPEEKDACAKGNFAEQEVRKFCFPFLLRQDTIPPRPTPPRLNASADFPFLRRFEGHVSNQEDAGIREVCKQFVQKSELLFRWEMMNRIRADNAVKSFLLPNGRKAIPKNRAGSGGLSAFSSVRFHTWFRKNPCRKPQPLLQ